ncbi:hypothetical protein DNHGIG_21550 [Collibacillus ludicampi]|uniref:Uncharacterized protein n=1 Tax=Collibacillus ludicampi TaxID=2771369 RepID=A0AAV4LFL0_9BACL|nr:hypothetical protein [Collibacillus ludicampi]GIM46606.1 hypothetical protein DNHGIG_21550 [Collibacillus ludicampi]
MKVHTFLQQFFSMYVLGGILLVVLSCRVNLPRREWVVIQVHGIENKRKRKNNNDPDDIDDDLNPICFILFG